MKPRWAINSQIIDNSHFSTSRDVVVGLDLFKDIVGSISAHCKGSPSYSNIKNVSLVYALSHLEGSIISQAPTYGVGKHLLHNALFGA